MSLLPTYRNGYYDDIGNWHSTKHCFRDCGTRCDCKPPGNLYYSKAHDKREAAPISKDKP